MFTYLIKLNQINLNHLLTSLKSLSRILISIFKLDFNETLKIVLLVNITNTAKHKKKTLKFSLDYFVCFSLNMIFLHYKWS
jgi:hypothetical protein